jgi:PAS domain S-box-containing protein
MVSLQEQIQRQPAVGPGPGPWQIGPVGLAVAVAVAYFLAARLSLLLLTKPGVAVFWPAAGISAGTMIALGRQARWPVAAGTVAATFAANLLGDRTIWGSGYFALCDAGEALLVAWLVERHFGARFGLGRLSRLLGFFAAASVGTAVSGLAGAVGYKLFHSPDDPLWITWQNWFSSDVIGIITVAPLIIGLVAAWRAPPPRRELAEGAAALLAIVVATGIIILVLPTDWWDIDVLVVLLLPLLLWPAARCRPVFAAAAVFAVSLMIVVALTFDVGHFNKAFESKSEVALTAQVGIVGVTLCSLILASLFAERRRHESEVEAREAGLQETLAAGGVLAFEWEPPTDEVRRSKNSAQILGIDAQDRVTGNSFFARLHPDDRARYGALVSGLSRDNPAFSITYRFMCPDGRERWLEENSKAEFDAAGRLARLKGLAVDITERRRAEEEQRALMAELRDSEGRMRAIFNTVVDGIITIDEKGTIETFNPAAASIFGYSAEDVVGRNINMLMPEPYRGEHHSYLNNYLTTGRAKIIGVGRAVTGQRKDGTIIPIDLAISEMTVAGRRMFTGVVRDITERKRAEERQKLLIAELDHRVKNVLARVAAVTESTRYDSGSTDEFVRALEGRIQSMAAAHGLLSQNGWQGVSLGVLVRNQLAPYATDGNVTISGADVVLTAAATQAIAMVLHELVTNAAKYGALSLPGGRVSISWERNSNDAKRSLLRIDWHELGGPPISGAIQSGYGTSLIRDLIPHELGGSVDLAFAPDGACCWIEVPLEPQ